MRVFRHLMLVSAVFVLGGCATKHPAVPHEISGTVEDEQGHPVANVEVECYRHSITAMRPAELEFKQRTSTDERGTFHFSVFDDHDLLRAHRAGVTPAWRLCGNVLNRVTKERLILTASDAITGSLVDQAGAPVADAEVWVFETASTTPLGEGQLSYDVLSGRPARQLYSTRTTVDGRFRIEGLPRNAVLNLAASKPGKALREPVLDADRAGVMQYRAGQQNIKLVMEPGGSIEGKVQVQKSTKTLAGVRLWLQCAPAIYSFDEGREAVASGSDGSFRFTNVPAGSFRIIAAFEGKTMPDWVSEPVDVMVNAGQTVRDVTVVASKGGQLQATVMDRKGRKPLAGTFVSVGKPTYRAGSPADSRGIALLRLPPGEYVASAVKGDWSVAQTNVRVEAGRTSRIQFELDAPLKLTGILSDPTGAPAADVPVGLVPGSSSESTRTDANGRFELTWNPRPLGSLAMASDYSLVARDWRRNLAVAQDIDNSDTSVDLRLQPALEASGQVKDEAGNPITNATVKVMLHTRNTTSDFDRQQVETDAQGRFKLTVLPPARAFGILVSAKGYDWLNYRLEADTTRTNRMELPPLVLKRTKH